MSRLVWRSNVVETSVQMVGIKRAWWGLLAVEKGRSMGRWRWGCWACSGQDSSKGGEMWWCRLHGSGCCAAVGVVVTEQVARRREGGCETLVTERARTESLRGRLE